MALADPQTITINTVPETCNRIKSEGLRSTYQTPDGDVTFVVSHQNSAKRTRRMMRVDQRKVAADPLTSENEYKSAGVYLVVDQPEYGFSDAELDYLVQALVDWMTTANVTKVLGNQH